MSNVQSTASPPVRLPKPPTKQELILALRVAGDASGLMRSYLHKGRMDPDDAEALILSLHRLRREIGTSFGGPIACFENRVSVLEQDETYADELPSAEIA
jgi:hypothetical protein